nr:hypothetical protein [Morchella crassipes]
MLCGEWRGGRGRKDSKPPPPSIHKFSFLNFLPDLYGADPAPPGEKNQEMKRGATPPPFQTITHVVVMKRGDLERGGGEVGERGVKPLAAHPGGAAFATAYNTLLEKIGFGELIISDSFQTFKPPPSAFPWLSDFHYIYIYIYNES